MSSNAHHMKKGFLLACSIIVMLLSSGVFSLIFFLKADQEQTFFLIMVSLIGVLTSAIYYSGYRDYDMFKKDGQKDIDPF